jgi:hypothetical protein
MNNNKIEINFEDNVLCNTITMKPIYGYNKELMCGEIKYFDKIYLLDLADKDKIINFNKSFIFVTENDIYPSFPTNYKRFTYLDFIFKYNSESVFYNFKNSNKYDLRHCNVEIYHFYHKTIIENYNFVEYIEGHYSRMGQDANIMKNPIWRIKENEKEYLLLYCEKETLVKLCPESYQKIIDFEQKNNNNKKLSWYKNSYGYIQTRIHRDHKGLYIHQVITGCYGNGKGTLNISVDHIDQNPLNNSFENLRIATRKEQEQNSKGIKEGTKRERKHNAKDLPEGIRQDMMRKYVVYYQEWLDKGHTREREFFKIEKHPKLDKFWSTTKSNKVSIEEKLTQANKVVDDLEDNIYPEKKEQSLPKYVSLIVAREKPHLVFEKRVEDKRLNIKMVLPEEYDLQEQLIILNDKIKAKYEGEYVL